MTLAEVTHALTDYGRRLECITCDVAIRRMGSQQCRRTGYNITGEITEIKPLLLMQSVGDRKV